MSRETTHFNFRRSAPSDFRPKLFGKDAVVAFSDNEFRSASTGCSQKKGREIGGRLTSNLGHRKREHSLLPAAGFCS
jgi:hypothetical protein